MNMWRPRFKLCGFVLVAAVSCTKDKPARPDSATSVVVAPPTSTPALPNTGWNESVAGRAMLLALPDNPHVALIVLPYRTDSSMATNAVAGIDSLSGTVVELFDRGGLAGSTTIQVNPAQPSQDACVSWPRSTLDEIPLRPWRIGFIRGAVVPIRLDSLETMSPQDSAFVTREMARLSSTVAEGNDPTFAGLPFVIRRAYRFELNGSTTLIADVVRRLSEEANPREEHLLVVAEKAGKESSYSTVFQSRDAGTEEAVRTSEILGAVRFVKNQRIAFVISFEYEGGGRVALLERSGDRAWKIAWRSAYTGC